MDLPDRHRPGTRGGAAYADGGVFLNTLDAHTIGVDGETGEEIWRRVGDIDQGESMSMAPLVVRNKVLVGNSGGEFGVCGWLTALDARSGAIAWRACGTGPDGEEAARLTGGDREGGRVAIGAYGRGACHTIPGVRGADAQAGP
ncbi:MAG TPA: PQQ-binding-like beta-propeller repeat protein, partial [Gemmatimonadales bacterium]|nr:PQQ-binding-like beta-propeller repeat protein [Gemmatimonadales bacterium]